MVSLLNGEQFKYENNSSWPYILVFYALVGFAIKFSLIQSIDYVPYLTLLLLLY